MKDALEAAQSLASGLFCPGLCGHLLVHDHGRRTPYPASSVLRSLQPVSAGAPVSEPWPACSVFPPGEHPERRSRALQKPGWVGGPLRRSTKSATFPTSVFS